MSHKELRSALREMSLPQLQRVHHELSRLQRSAKPYRRFRLAAKAAIVEKFITRAERHLQSV